MLDTDIAAIERTMISGYIRERAEDYRREARNQERKRKKAAKVYRCCAGALEIMAGEIEASDQDDDAAEAA